MFEITGRYSDVFLFCLFYRLQLNIEESKITIEMKLADFSHEK